MKKKSEFVSVVLDSNTLLIHETLVDKISLFGIRPKGIP